MAEPVDLPKANVSSLPVELRTFTLKYLSRTDETLFRLERLLSTTTGLETVLAPLNYTLYLFIYLQSRRFSSFSAPLRLLTHVLSHLRLRLRLSSSPSSSHKLGPQLNSSATTTATTATATSLTHLNDLVTSSRNTLRLTALLPLYTYLRTLLSQRTSASAGAAGQPSTDATIHRINLLQASSYILYQVLENVAHLLDLSVPLPFSSFHFSSPSVHPNPNSTTTTRLYLYSNRFWLLGLTCDLARLAREAALERRGRKVNSVGKRALARSVAEQEEVDRRWRDEFLTASCWWPVVLNWSLEDGVRGFNDGMIGVLGLFGAIPALRQQWNETKQVGR